MWDGSLNITIAGPHPSGYFFHGSSAKAHFIRERYASDVSSLQIYRQGIPNIKILIDFNDPQITQMFRNRVSSGPGMSTALNGAYNTSDYQDLQYNDEFKWHSTYPFQKISLPKAQDFPVEKVSFAFHIRFQLVNINTFFMDTVSFCLLHRYKISGPTLTSKYQLQLIKYHWTSAYCLNSLLLNNEVFQPNRCLYYNYNSAENKANAVSFTQSLHYMANEQLLLHAFSLNDAPLTYKPSSFPTSPGSDFEDDDQLNLGGCEGTVPKPGVFPYFYSTNSMNEQPSQLTIKFQEFQLYQGAYLVSQTASAACQPTATILAGFEKSAFPVACQAGSINIWEARSCLSELPEGTLECSHNMEQVNGLCYRCPRGYGNSGNGACQKCAEGCLSCAGSQPDQCTYCDRGYGFKGTTCKPCDYRQEVFDVETNTCQKIKMHKHDLYGPPATVGELSIYFVAFATFGNPSAFLDNSFDLTWIKDINNFYYIYRNYTDLPRHRKVAMSFEIMVVNANFSIIGLAVDQQFIRYYSTSLWYKPMKF